MKTTKLEKILNSTLPIERKISQLTILALKAFPSSPTQIAIQRARAKLMREKEISLINRIDEICEQYGNNSERIIAAAAKIGCWTDSWYVAARHIATYEETPDYLKPLIDIKD